MTARQVAHPARRFERDDAAEAVSDQMHAIGAAFAHARAQALARCGGVTEHARVIEHVDGKPRGAQAARRI